MKFNGKWLLGLMAVLALVVAIPLSVSLLRRDTAPTDSFAAGEAVNIYFQPSQDTLPPAKTEQLWLDAKTNQVGFVRIDLTFDRTKVNLSGEITTNPAFSQLLANTSMANANSTGALSVVLGTQPGQPLPTGQFWLIRIPLIQVGSIFGTTTINLTQTQFPTGGWQTPQILDTSTTTRALDFTYTPLTLTLNPVPTTTPTRTPTPIPPTPTPTRTPTPIPPTPTPTRTPTPLSTPTPTPLPRVGDANNDNIVNGQDYVIWLAHYGQHLVPADHHNGDFDLNGEIDGRDYILWLNNYGP